MSKIPLSEDLVTLVQAIREDKPLCEWFLRLEHCPPALRLTAFGTMAAQMRAAGEDAALISAITTLARPEIYEAVCRTLQELRQE